MAADGGLEIWWVRHGQTAANHHRVVQGHTDTALDEVGERQAARLGAWAARQALAFDRVVASPLARAARTARAVAEPLGVDVTLDERLKEQGFGEWEGRPAAEVYAEREKADDPLALRPPGGESARDMAARVLVALDAWVEAVPVGRVLLVSHGGPIGAVLTRAAGLAYTVESVRRFSRDNTGITVLARKAPERPFKLKMVNARPHLDVE